ncbi:MAG TPA: alkaline phosphatase PafA [Chitinophagaceae bacterium]|nr:alkaline phosphatase PafA [Chitinophagaceae bacterium]
MKKLSCLTALIFSLTVLFAQTSSRKTIDRPRLVVGIVVDQMRWDFLYRYYDRYQVNGGFRRMLDKGFSCENTFIPYAPTVTACGHTCIYTGSMPAIHGITGNAWYDRSQRRSVYCTEDTSVHTVGGAEGANGRQSPRNLLVSTICDELKLATNFRSKVIGIAIKDRGGILPAGHTANAAYWYDSRSGNWITSDYYMQQLPAWVQSLNNKKLPDAYYAKGWNTLYPINTYVQSTTDEKVYESKPFGADAKGFPYNFSKYVGTNYGILATTPYGNSFTFDMARAAVEGEMLGRDSITDILAVSFSSPDYIGHSFGPNSIEVEDTYLRLDRELGEFFRYLDAKVGAGQYLAFLSADHGVAHIPGFMQEYKLPGKAMDEAPFMAEMAPLLKQQFGSDKLIVSSYNYQVHLDHRLIDSLKIDLKAVKKWIAAYLEKKEPIARAFDIDEVMLEPMPQKVREMIANGYNPNRNGDVQFILKPHYIDGWNTGTTHGLWNPYDAHIPLLWYGWGVKTGKLNREVYMSDIAPTLAAMLKIQMPGGSVGNVIVEVMK